MKPSRGKRLESGRGFWVFAGAAVCWPVSEDGVPSGARSPWLVKVQAPSLVFSQIAAAAGWGSKFPLVTRRELRLLRFGVVWCNLSGIRWGKPDRS